MYKIIIGRRDAKEIESLPNDVIQHVTDAISHLKSTPRPHGVKKLVGEDGWRIRIRDYRILYTVDDAQGIIAVYRVKHRREAYR